MLGDSRVILAVKKFTYNYHIKVSNNYKIKINLTQFLSVWLKLMKDIHFFTRMKNEYAVKQKNDSSSKIQSKPSHESTYMI